MKTIFAGATVAALMLTGCNDAASDKATTNVAGGTNGAVTAPAGTDWTTTVAATPQGGFRMGNPDARVKIVEFASMTCGVCKQFSADSNPAFYENYIKSGNVSFEFRNFVMNQVDVISALLARCGGPQPFFKITEQMFTEQGETLGRVQAASAEMAAAESLPGAQTFVRVAELAGLDKFVGMRGIPSAKATACLTDKAELDRLVAMQQAGVKDYKVAGTPTFLVNDKPVPDAITWAALEPKIKAALGS